MDFKYLTPEFTQQMVDATEDWAINPKETGDIYHIVHDDKIIGITGWWTFDCKVAYLRWHGILPEYRGKAFGKRALVFLAQNLRAQFRSVINVTYSDAPVGFFLKSGFVEIDDHEIIDRYKNQENEDGRHFLKYRENFSLQCLAETEVGILLP